MTSTIQDRVKAAAKNKTGNTGRRWSTAKTAPTTSNAEDILQSIIKDWNDKAKQD